jgi:hypothetical protein
MPPNSAIRTIRYRIAFFLSAHPEEEFASRSWNFNSSNPATIGVNPRPSRRFSVEENPADAVITPEADKGSNVKRFAGAVSSYRRPHLKRAALLRPSAGALSPALGTRHPSQRPFATTGKRHGNMLASATTLSPLAFNSLL